MLNLRSFSFKTLQSTNMNLFKSPSYSFRRFVIIMTKKFHFDFFKIRITFGIIDYRKVENAKHGKFE